MCGIFGAVKTEKSKGGISVSCLTQQAVSCENRGRHAWGIAWIDDDGRIHHYKRPGKISDSLAIITEIGHSARAIIGHTRHFTHGSPEHNVNNHPHPTDGGWMVHNGIVGNYEELARTHNIRQVGECDSEVLAALIGMMRGKSLNLRVKQAVDKVSVWNPLAIAGLWPRPARFVLARRGNPVFTGLRKGVMYFASTPGGVPNHKEMLANSVMQIDLTTGNAASLDLLSFRETGVRYRGSGTTMAEDGDDGWVGYQQRFRGQSLGFNGFPYGHGGTETPVEKQAAQYGLRDRDGNALNRRTSGKPADIVAGSSVGKAYGKARRKVWSDSLEDRRLLPQGGKAPINFEDESETDRIFREIQERHPDFNPETALIRAPQTPTE